MSNVDERLVAYKRRLLALTEEKQRVAEDISELNKEMKGVGVSKDEAAGVKLAVKRSFETADKKATRITAEEIADSLGDYADMPLGKAAVAAADLPQH